MASPHGSFGPWMEVHGQSPARGVHLSLLGTLDIRVACAYHAGPGLFRGERFRTFLGLVSGAGFWGLRRELIALKPMRI
jgi:hypothetical protein